MSDKQIPKVEAVATLLVHRGKILSVFNPRWGAFTFPISKRKMFRDTEVSEAAKPENLHRAAARVAGEVLGRSFATDEFPKPLADIKGFEQSDVDGVWKLYEFHIFTLEVSEGVALAQGVVGQWLTAKQFNSHEPVSHTARYLLSELDERGLLPKGPG
jgi:hypothetical protein